MAFEPIPVPVPGSTTFNVDAQSFALGLANFANDYNALASVLNGSIQSTSTTSLAIGTGSKSLTVQTGLNFVAGYPVRIADTATPTNYMDGIITSYNSGTGALVVNVSTVGGSGTIASWNVLVLPGGGNFASLSNNKYTGRQVLANEVTIASASTIDFTAGDSNQFLITGTTTITAVTMAQGAVVIARFSGACLLTYSSGLQIQGGVNYTTAAGDIVTFISDGSVVRAIISKFDGEPAVISGLIGVGGNSSTDYVTIPFRDKTTGVRRTLIIQWGSTVTSGGAGGFTQSLPLTMTTAVYYAATAQSDNQAATITGISSTAITGSVVDALVGANSANGITIKWTAWGFA